MPEVRALARAHNNCALSALALVVKAGESLLATVGTEAQAVGDETRPMRPADDSTRMSRSLSGMRSACRHRRRAQAQFGTNWCNAPLETMRNWLLLICSVKLPYRVSTCTVTKNTRPRVDRSTLALQLSPGQVYPSAARTVAGSGVTVSA